MPPPPGGRGGQPGAIGWRPTPEQGAYVAQMTDLVARGDPPAWELLEQGAAGLAKVTGDTCIALLLSDDGKWLHPLGLADPDPDAAAALESRHGIRVRADRGFSRQVLASCDALRLPETTPTLVRAGRPELGPFVEQFGVRSMIVAPMRSRGRALGQLALLRRRVDAEPLNEQDERFVQLVADWMALGLDSAGPPAVSLPATDVDPSTMLSGRERQVLALLSAGHTNREIAERLVLSVRTVEWHRARLHWKLGVSGRAALIEAARSRGLTDQRHQ